LSQAAALAASGSDETSSAIKTHGGLIAVFGLQLVKTGRVPPELGRMLNRAEEVRLDIMARHEVEAGHDV
jgi:uncharacterized protein (UPF0332 family)